ncbi:hypothetical protein [Mesorhizobium sp. M7A.F.Ca.CA.002.12.1.1]|uniref:hypothetical protein n=1 Tax=Mesorhizobium sp. M7A.F.Ca.CA.002.12.1.1 TaxID=2496735 RepID=UPI000FCC790D|nr:hypothetical protein [Mesorhizobium sp. M7A.F.Ca.CA.002.12.1.1]RUX60132.1 hypothetical protein EN989_10965 [Mesorhizobium sp. M7A.F.Ca.CA.002.12.1.1]
MNKLVVIGWLGIKTCYLNLSREDAIKRYKQDNPDSLFEEEALKRPDLIQEFEFEDEFGAYDAWKS